MGILNETRTLTAAEKALARTVFRGTINYDKIIVSDDLGWGNCPYTYYVDIPGWFTGGNYYIYMGKIAYPDLTSRKRMAHDNDEVRNTFIHEMTHVWQGEHRFFKTVFAESVASRLCAAVTGGDAYDYQWGLEWDDYNVEQQAKIVEAWFKEGASSTHKLYEYIRDHIRKA